MVPRTTAGLAPSTHLTDNLPRDDDDLEHLEDLALFKTRLNPFAKARRADLLHRPAEEPTRGDDSNDTNNRCHRDRDGAATIGTISARVPQTASVTFNAYGAIW